MTHTDYRLEARYIPLDDERMGQFELTLHNHSDRSLADFTLCYSALTRAGRGAVCVNATLLRRVANFHEFSPPKGYTLAPGARWSFVLEGLTHRPKHRLDGPKAAYVSLPSGNTPVTTLDLRTDAFPSGPLRRLPEGKIDIALAITPWPQDCMISAWRSDAPVLVPDAGSAEDRAAMSKIAALSQRLFPASRAPFAETGSGLGLTLAIDPLLPTDAYRLDFTTTGIALVFATPSGRDYGLITLAQIGRAAHAEPETFKFPATGRIADHPRYGWRGAHLDVSRHFWPLDDVLRFLDIMAWLKLNMFQWHLTDDEGWRLEINALPQLTAIGAFRGAGLPLLPQLGSGAEAYGGFYTQDQVRQAIAHASSLHIDIVPEIDIPGHSTAVLKALPHLIDPDEPQDSYRSIQGYPNNAINPGVEATQNFLDTVVGEVATLFPSRYIHVGSDEVDKESWLQSPRARVLMQYEGLGNTGEVQAHLLRRVQGTIRKHGKQLAGWDEASHGGGVDTEGTLLIAWQKRDVLAKLVAEGYDVIASPGQAYYLDMVQAEGWDEPGASWAGTVTPQSTYEYEAAGDLPADQRHRLKGVQACIWSEHLVNKALFNHMVFPRLGAVAEAGWTEPAAKNWQRFAKLSKGLPEL